MSADLIRRAFEVLREHDDMALIALMHPPVALEIARWLFAVAIDDAWEPESAPRIRERTAALLVARAILREPEDGTS